MGNVGNWFSQVRGTQGPRVITGHLLWAPNCLQQPRACTAKGSLGCERQRVLVHKPMENQAEI